MINRYEVYPVIYSLSHWETRHIISDKGDWVDYEDHLEEIEAVKNRVCDIVKDWADEIRLPSGYNDDLEKLYKKIKSEEK